MYSSNYGFHIICSTTCMRETLSCQYQALNKTLQSYWNTYRIIFVQYLHALSHI